MNEVAEAKNFGLSPSHLHASPSRLCPKGESAKVEVANWNILLSHLLQLYLKVAFISISSSPIPPLSLIMIIYFHKYFEPFKAFDISQLLIQLSTVHPKIIRNVPINLKLVRKVTNTCISWFYIHQIAFYFETQIK